MAACLHTPMMLLAAGLLLLLAPAALARAGAQPVAAVKKWSTGDEFGSFGRLGSDDFCGSFSLPLTNIELPGDKQLRNCSTRPAKGASPWLACYCRRLHEVAAAAGGKAVIWSHDGDPIYVRM